MKPYCLKCRKDTEKINPEVKTKKLKIYLKSRNKRTIK